MESSQTPLERNRILDRYEDTGDSRKDVRRFLRRCVNPDRLYSLDEIAGVVSTLATVALAFLALSLSDYRLVFGVLTAVTSVFFWIGYRIGKIRHAIDVRFAVILSFVMFLYIAFGFSVVSFLTAPMGSTLLIVSAAIAAVVVLLATFISVKPVVQAQRSLCKWLLCDDIVQVMEKDEELERAMTDSFRGLVDASESNALIAGFLAFFFYYPISSPIIVIILVVHVMALIVIFRFGTMYKKIADGIIRLKEKNEERVVGE